MVKSLLNKAVENAVANIVADFQRYPKRFWNERDIHWSLFYYIKQEKVVKEAYPTELIRAEFPTFNTYGTERPSRGHYDLVILDAESYNVPEVQDMENQEPWSEYLKFVKITVAIEVKLWWIRSRSDLMADRASRDITKLTDKPSNIESAYFLNFVQLDFQREYNKAYYQQLREYLVNQKQSGLNILYAPSDPNIQPNPKQYWL